MRLRRREPDPLLSVVVPAYQVRDYLADCLASILDQSWRHLEVVVVDDGSTDGTGDIADEIAARDPRVTVVHQANAGLGAARNAGVRHATGEYLTFADSDDLLVPGAYAAMVGSLQRSGSDIAIGAVERLRGEERFMTPLMKENHRAGGEAVRLEERPLLLADVFAWNKVYRRRFWDEAKLEFPAGVRYEDQPALTRALVAAGTLDVLTEPVYLWRVREDGSSISQQRSDPRDLADRLLTKRWSTETVLAGCSGATRHVWFARVLPIDMWEYFRAVPGCADDYWAMLRDGVRELWNDATVPFEETALPLRQRLMGWLVGRDRRTDLEALLEHLDRNPGPLPHRELDGRTVVDHPFADDPDLPAALLRP
ncbi:glycosyltransferase family 2 protein [Nocardioides sp. GCM10027113]|uniref:glycosyltransferase family 2 protein n=1 Tax=unclassified Nocardioides TaxID=2615069 RepID=UPI00361407A8